jgi:hypothetical protein
MTSIVYATATAAVPDIALGYTVRVMHGEPWAADDPFVASHPDFFSAECPTNAVRRTVAPALVETATKAPGERRTVKRAQ